MVIEKGNKMGHRTLVLQSEYFPAQPIFLSASYLAFGGSGGTISRLSRRVVLPSALSVIKLGRKMIGAGKWDTADGLSIRIYLPPIFLPTGGAGLVDVAER
ncbi:hypothetical protein [Novipirellula rosea]|uniref:hypothetical protein n=1 Tax=Novipirellula rosea TaxID=1031540 RepID=UPI0031F0CFCD